MSGHTNGPWIQMGSSVGTEVGEIATCRNEGEKFDSRANARLIAAAPDFYAMAEMVLAWWDKHQYDTISGADGDEWNVYDDEPDFVTAARAAKAKADGETT